MAENTDTKELIIPNTFNVGIDTDSLEGSQPPGTYRHARGVVLATADHGQSHYLANEASQRFCASLPEGYTLRGYHGVEEREWFIVASVDASGNGEIGYFDVLNCKYFPIIKDSDIDGCGLSLSIEEWVMDMESKVLQPCNSLHLYYSSDHTYYRIPVDEILEGRQELPIKCKDVLLFSCPCVPPVEVAASQTGGTDLLGGAYKAAVQLEDEDGNTTNWFPLSNAVYLGSENNTAGEPGTGSISITVDAIDANYEYVNIAIVSQTAGATTAAVVARRAHGNSSIGFVYRSQKQIIRDISIEEMLTKKPGYLRGKGLVQHKGHLFLYALRGERNLNYQRRALQIKTSYEVGLVPAKSADQFSGFRGGEVQAATIKWNYCDSTSTRDFVLMSSAPSAEGAINCGDCVDRFANTKGVRTSGELQDNFRREWTKSPDSYQPFEPTDQDLLDQDDADIPNIDPIRDLGSGGDNDDCDCEVVNGLGFLARAAVAAGLNGIDVSGGGLLANTVEILAAIEIREKQCRCRGDAGGDPEGITERLQPAPAGATFNDADVDAIRSSYAMTSLQQGLTTPVPTALQIKETLQIRYAFDPEAEVSDLTQRRKDQEELTSRLSKSPSTQEQSISSVTDEPTDDPNGCFGSAGNGTGGQTGGGGGGGQTLSLTSASPPEPTEPNTPDCEDDLTAGGVPPEYDSSVSNAGGGSDYPKPKDTYSGITSGGFGGGEAPEPYTPCKPEIIYEEDCCTIKKVIPCIDGEGDLAYWESCEKYPTQLDCDGEPVFGEMAGKPIRHLKFPGRDVEPHIISYQDGVPTKYNRDNFEGNDTYVRLLWLKLENIVPPSPDELDKPLCPFNPFTISVVPLDASNRSIVASGVALNTFEGQVNGNPTLFPRNGVNGAVACDRYVNNNGSRRGNDALPSTPTYVFHSPDTTFDRPGLDIDTVHFRQSLSGKGHRHGLYQQGEQPDSINLGRKNRKGCRQQAHLNHWTLTPDQTDCSKAAAYLDANAFGDRADDFTRSISNIYRESSVVFETTGAVRGTIDGSFDGVVSQHESAFEVSGLYVDLRKNIPDQFGSVTSMSVSPIHQGTKAELASGSCTVRSGGSFVNRMSVKRTSYVSDKVGEDISPPFEFGGGLAELPIISRLLKWFFSTIGGEDCGTVPVSGNGADPRNVDALNGLSEGGDTYFPSVQSTLLTFWVESNVNLAFRSGSDSPDEAHYRDLAGLALDSSMGGGDSDDDYYLDRFYATMNENPKWRMILRMIVNALFTYGIGIYLLIYGIDCILNPTSRFIVGVSTSVGIVIAVFMGALIALIGILWVIAWVNTNLDNRFLDNVLGVNGCFPDYRAAVDNGSPWAMYDRRLRQWKANFWKYSYDFSSLLQVEVGLVIPDPYNTCDCLNEVGTTVYYSNKQNPGSWTDAYRNFQAISYLEIPPNTGPLKKMFSRADTLYALTTDMPYQLSIGNARLDTDGVAIGLKPVAVVSEPSALFGGIPEGHAGILDANAVRNTTMGFLWIDREAGTLYSLSGSNLEAISLSGMQVDMAQYLRFELLDRFPDYAGSVDQKIEGDIGFEIGYDPALGRIMLTKHDYSPKEGVTYSGGSFMLNGDLVPLGGDAFCKRSITFSYYPSRKRWISEHEYKPQVYMSDRRHMYSLSEGNLWIHDAFNREYMKVYGEPSDMYVEFALHTGLAGTSIRERMTYDYTEIIQDTRKLDRGQQVQYVRDSFNKVHLWSPHGSSDVRNLILDNQRSKEERAEFGEDDAYYSYTGRRVRFNTLTDKLIDPTQAVFEQSCDLFDRTPSEANHKNVGERDNIVSDYFVMGLRRLPEHTTRIYLEAVLNKVKTKEL